MFEKTEAREYKADCSESNCELETSESFWFQMPCSYVTSIFLSRDNLWRGYEWLNIKPDNEGGINL